MAEAGPLLRGRTAAALILVGALIAVLALIAVPRTAPPSAPAAPVASAAAPDIYALSYPNADAQPQALAQWQGQRLLLNFWATWCTPCVAEMPQLDRARGAAAAHGIAIVALGTEDARKVRAFRDKTGLRMTLLAGGYDALELARRLGDTQGVLPYTVLLGPHGEMLRSHSGPLEPGQLDQWIASAP